MSNTTEQIQDRPQEHKSQTFEALIGKKSKLAELIATFANTEGGVITINASERVTNEQVKRMYEEGLSQLKPHPETSLVFNKNDGTERGVLTVEKAPQQIQVSQTAILWIDDTAPDGPRYFFRKWFFLSPLIGQENADEVLDLRRKRKGARAKRDIGIMIVCFLVFLLSGSFVVFRSNLDLPSKFIITILAALIIGVVLVANLLISYKHSLEAKFDYNKEQPEPIREKLDKDMWERTWKEYELHINLYRYYLDIGLKVTVFFFFVTGAIVGFYLRNPKWPMQLSLLLPFLMCLAFVGVSFHGAILWSRVTYIIKDIRKELGIKKAPDINLMTLLLVVYGAVFLIIGAAIVWLAIFGENLITPVSN